MLQCNYTGFDDSMHMNKACTVYFKVIKGNQ